MLLGLLLLPLYAFAALVLGAVLWSQLVVAWHSGVVLWCAVAVVLGFALLCVPSRKR